MTLKELGLDHVDGYHITDLYDDYDYGIVTPDRRFKVDVNPSGSELNWPLNNESWVNHKDRLGVWEEKVADAQV